MLDFIGIGCDMLPVVSKSGVCIGKYKNIDVMTGALDQIAGTIGTGAVEQGKISVMTGTIMAICSMTDEIPPYREGLAVPCHLHAAEGKYCTVMCSATAGMALKWFREQFASEMSFEQLDRLASQIPSGSDGLTVLPYFAGSAIPYNDPSARAVFDGITLSHTKAHFARAIMESVAFMLRQILEYADAPENCEIRITGGAASSPLWSQMKAVVTGKCLNTVSESETACLGSAILAMVGSGEYPSAEEAVKHTVSVQKSYTPGSNGYDSAYERYCTLNKKQMENK